LPAFIAGVALAQFLAERPEVAQRVRTVAFAVFTPFFFLKAGALLDATVLVQGGATVLILFLARIGTKLAGVLPVTAYLRYPARTVWFTALVMSTGLTFDVIIALFGLDHGLIDRTMYGIIVTVAIASAVVPTLIAQAWFRPNLAALAEREAAG
jgi:Kef-type K+ transport system membrane component KefB